MKRVLAFTSSRSDYGILRPLFRQLIASDEVDLGLFVTGSHLAPAHGRTIEEIERDGMPIVASQEILQPSQDVDGDSWQATAGAAARSIESSAAALMSWRPDVALVLGDRFEALGFAMACHFSQTPLAHLHGGETTEGAIDDACRHAITKFSTLHFPASAEFARRIAQLGEDPNNVITVGALGLDSILEDRTRIEASPRGTGRLLITYHPVTLGAENDVAVMERIVKAGLATEAIELLVTLPNADHGGVALRSACAELARTYPDRVRVVDSLGASGFHVETYGAMAVVGNSSSGLIEAPFLGTPTLNIGPRQDGRPRADGVFDATTDHASIEHGLRLAIDHKTDMEPFAPTVYGDGKSARRIVRALVGAGAGTMKRFHDINVDPDEGTKA